MSAPHSYGSRARTRLLVSALLLPGLAGCVSLKQQRLAPGVEVMTTSGIYGTVVGVDDTSIQLEVAPGTTVRVAKPAVGQVLTGDAVGAGDDRDRIALERLGREYVHLLEHKVRHLALDPWNTTAHTLNVPKPRSGRQGQRRPSPRGDGQNSLWPAHALGGHGQAPSVLAAELPLG